jgi:hypothetical protein
LGGEPDIKSHSDPGANDPAQAGGTIMLTRRGFGGVASCAICGLAGFLATDASAQGTQPSASGGVTRKVLSQIDGPMPGYTTIIQDVTIEAGTTVPRHTHPGIESSYVIESDGLELSVEGQPNRRLSCSAIPNSDASYSTPAAQGEKNEPIENLRHSDVARLPRPVDGKRARTRL